VRPAVRSVSLLALLLLAACEDGARRWEWRDLGTLPAPATTTINHTPLVVSGGRVLVGSGDGIWARPLDGGGAWTRVGLAGIGIFATRRHANLEATVFAAGQPGDDPQAPPFWRTDDGGATWVPSAGFPRNPFDGASEAFYDLAVAADDPDRLYANLSGPSIAVSTDGGQNWALANGATDVYFGYSCVIHVLDSTPGTLFQGCEAPLDVAWVATQDIDPADPFTLANFTYVAGGPDYALENRRPNAMASGPARPGTLYVGLEGALIALDDSGFEFLFRAADGSGPQPYAYVTAVWLDPADGDHLVFGGGVNGENTTLSLFETFDHGLTLRELAAPVQLTDPAVVQIVPAAGGLAVLLSVADPQHAGGRTLRLFLLQ